MDEIKTEETIEEKKEETKDEVKKEQVHKKIMKCVCDNKQKAIAVIVLALIVVGAGVYFYKIKKTDIGVAGAKSRIEKFLADTGTKATIKDVTQESDLYKITVTVSNQDVVTYLTKDGKNFFTQAINLDEASKQAADQTNQQAAAPQQNIPKTAKPAVDLYVMAYCPFGNKAEDTLKPVYDLLKSKVDFNFHYIVTTSGQDVQSLHGPNEVAEDEREACVLKNYGKDKWFGFATYVNANCGSDGACWETGAKNLGISNAKISACVNSEGVALMKANEKVSVAAGAQGSPTMVVNGVTTQAVYQYGNSEAYKQAICGAFNAAPAECAKALSAQTSTAQGGSCGN